jgi:hypothetical protein
LFSLTAPPGVGRTLISEDHKAFQYVGWPIGVVFREMVSTWWALWIDSCATPPISRRNHDVDSGNREQIMK